MGFDDLWQNLGKIWQANLLSEINLLDENFDDSIRGTNDKFIMAKSLGKFWQEDLLP